MPPTTQIGFWRSLCRADRPCPPGPPLSCDPVDGRSGITNPYGRSKYIIEQILEDLYAVSCPGLLLPATSVGLRIRPMPWWAARSPLLGRALCPSRSQAHCALFPRPVCSGETLRTPLPISRFPVCPLSARRARRGSSGASARCVTSTLSGRTRRARLARTPPASPTTSCPSWRRYSHHRCPAPASAFCAPLVNGPLSSGRVHRGWRPSESLLVCAPGSLPAIAQTFPGTHRTTSETHPPPVFMLCLASG